MSANTKSLPKPEELSGFAALWSAFWASARKELTILSRYPVQFFASFGQVFLIVAIFTLAGSMFSPVDGSGAGSVAGVVIYGFVLFLFLNDALWTIGYSVRQEQVLGTLEQLYMSPANKFANLASRVVHLITWTTLLALRSVFVMGNMMGGIPFNNAWLGLYILILSLIGTFGVGFAFAAITIRIKESAQTLLNLLQFSFLILCANFFPFSALPEPVRWISRIIPLSYSVDAFRSTLMGYPPGFPELAPIEVELVIVTAFGVLMPLIGYWMYRSAERASRRSGSLAEF